MFLIPEDYWEIKQTPEKGRGVFAKKNIDAGTVIGDYLGTVLKTSEVDFNELDKHLYLLYYHDQASVYPDITAPGVHLFNHSCAPNCWMYIYKGHTLFFALRQIFSGEELTVSYLLAPQSGYCRSCTHICTCGHMFCTGTMHLSEQRYEAWNTFREKEETRTKKARITYGKMLTPLSSYPQSIEDNPIYTLYGSVQEAPLTVDLITVPPLAKLRTLIRTSGRNLCFPSPGITILGVAENAVIATSLSGV
ncbi:MAG: hypothetical protein RI947_810 [Candidatus Parcubacteria bacterium]|jgi:hypothetical protein